MSGRKRRASVAQDEGPSCKKRGVTSKTVDKWIAKNDKTLNMTMWLKYDRLDREYVSSLKSCMCVHFQDQLCSVRNYNLAFIIGSKNLRTSSFKEHARSDMHLFAMMLFRKSQSSGDVTEYAPITKALT